MITLLLAATINAAAIKAHIDFLASDLLEGRETGSRGFDIAANYVASQFAAAGLAPQFQRIEFTSAQVDETRSSLTLDGKKLVNRKEVLFQPIFSTPTANADGPVVFAGFGGESDYARIDTRGKIVLMLSGAPPQLPSDERAYFSDNDVKRKSAASHGAVGVIVLKTITDEKRRSFAKAAAQSKMKSMRVKGDFGETAILASINISRDAAKKFFAHAPVSLDQVLDDAEKGVAHSFPLEVGAKIRTVSKFAPATSENVIARVQGNTNDNVVITAHLDHLGLAPHPQPLSPPRGERVAEGRVRGDRVYNGALDNASGIAALIEIARAFAALPQRPQRSVVFVAVTGEEKGELGSEYFAKHPTASPIVADINMDMFTMLFPAKDVIALGAEHSSLGEMARQAAAEAGFEVSPDPQPEEVRFIRSDQYSFVQQGIPAMIFKPGMKSSDPAVDGEKVTRDWLHDVYHTVKDNPDQKLDYASGARWADANFRLALAVANAPEKPAWKKGDFFGDKFGGAK